MDQTSRIPDILTGNNFQALVRWMGSENEPAPPFAEEFMVTLDLLYMAKTGNDIPRRRAPSRAASKLTLGYIASEEPKKAAPAPATEIRRKFLDRIEDLGEKPSAPRAGDGVIPFSDENGFRECGMDSFEIAKAIAWHYTYTDVEGSKRPLSMNFIHATLFTIYGTFLAERNARLTTEHPQMWHYGPIFPRVKTQFEKVRNLITEGQQSAARIRQQDPVLSEFIKDTIRRNASRRMKDITDPMTSPSSPWGICRKENPDKWGTVLDDNEIARWYRKLIDKSKQ